MLFSKFDHNKRYPYVGCQTIDLDYCRLRKRFNNCPCINPTMLISRHRAISFALMHCLILQPTQLLRQPLLLSARQIHPQIVDLIL